MPKSTKKTTKRKRATLKDLPATSKEVTRKEMKGVEGKGLTYTPSAPQVTISVAPQFTLGVAPQPAIDPKITVTK